MKKKMLALTLAAFVACGAAGCGGEEKKPAPKPENKQTTNVKKDEKQKAPEKKVDPAVKHAQEVMKLPHVAKYDQISKDAFPHLTWGNTGYSYKDYPGKGKEGKGALLAYGDIDVLVGGCKGNCVIEATSTHTKRLDPASYDKPVVEKKVLVPFDKTYVRHDENGKKWVTHEKCGTK